MIVYTNHELNHYTNRSFFSRIAKCMFNVHVLKRFTECVKIFCKVHIKYLFKIGLHVVKLRVIGLNLSNHLIHHRLSCQMMYFYAVC